MQALFAMVVMFGLAIHPAVDVSDAKHPKLDLDKVKVEQVYKLND